MYLQQLSVRCSAPSPSTSRSVPPAPDTNLLSSSPHLSSTAMTDMPNGTRNEASGPSSGDGVKYRVVRYESWADLLVALLSFLIPPLRFIWPKQVMYHSHPDIRHAERKSIHKPRVQALESMSHALLVVLLALKLPLALVGAAFEWFLNFHNVNNGFIGLLSKLLTLNFQGIIFRPYEYDPSQYYSIVGWIDPRMELIHPYASNLRVDPQTGKFHYQSRNFADLCIMAAKLAYESGYVQKAVVNEQWKMCFRQHYEYQNAHEKPLGYLQKFLLRTLASAEKHFSGVPYFRTLVRTMEEWMVLRPKTQAFVFSDKSTDANLIVLAFRGTEPFNMDDWATDFDFSFVDLDDGIGRLHLGFLEALGIVDRDEIEDSAVRLKENLLDPEKELTTGLSQGKLDSMASENVKNLGAKPPERIESRKGEAAYEVSLFERLNADIIELLKENPNAQVVVTGHSLGAALAAVFGALVLFDNAKSKEKKLLAARLAAIYAFAQPRVGDDTFAASMERKLEQHNVQYYRVVYANDLVPRVPFDDRVFGFKHFGFCCYSNIRYQQKALIEEPNRNYMDGVFSIVMRMDAARELVNGMVLNRIMYGDDFLETTLMTVARFMAFIMPGLVAHSPNNYVNAIRLGPANLKIVPFDDESTPLAQHD